MCGIGAVARIDGGHLDAGVDGLLERLAQVLAHRGPDERELLREGPVGLAFTRLSLTDPDGGSQPLTLDDGSLTLIANGEVYNHRELAASLPTGTRMRTGSDCEVLLHLYRERGIRFLDDVRGMFAVILWDRRAGRLLLARDRFGIKPLYFHRNASRIILSSEMKALFLDGETPRRFDWDTALTTPALAASPTFSEAPVTTWFEDVNAVPAGTIMRIDLNGGHTSEHPYWSFPGTIRDIPRTADDFVERYRALLADSVRECATADAELGLFLSGGVDSAAVAALAAAQDVPLHTFTVLSAATYRNQDAEYAHRVAEKLGLPNHQVLFDGEHVPTAAEWKRLLWLTETPLCSPEIYYKHELHRYAKVARPHLRGMLLGAASDEFNGGYSVDMAGGGDWHDFTVQLAAMTRTGRLRDRPDLAPWWAHGNAGLLTDEAVADLTGAAPGDPYHEYLAGQYRKIQQYNVWHEDRSAAGSGIEARVPFLDHRLVELAAAVPPHLRPQLLWDKQILRRGVRDLLPEDVAARPKTPFFYGPGLPHTYRMLTRMLERDGGALIDEALSAPGAERYLNADGVRDRLRQAVADPTSSQIEMALRVVNLGLLAAMAVDLPPATRSTPSGSVRPSLSVQDWAGQRAKVELSVGLRPTLAAGLVPRLADGVLLLTRPAESDRWYLAVDGVIEYVLDGDNPTYRDLLTRVDGQTSLGMLLDDLDVTLDDLRPVLTDLTDQGLLELPGAYPA
ncbi:asparagine synthase (glutamine-hydrolyzing) [Couchioplanes caeruleus]|uniref:asparagine synthase (glutamine-hydrolyzing) n=3 Tax=Couchioplanes caeruleus TaxID=56438 RepID=A0A1K0FJ23_9ACTN|nr:asparagine synthase (glutamine-hydrolyzing) [Couchioplanes caeruleus]OJF12825.1 asparagine synthase (glutamine-hydrolyzing) [Couchioplanes caeruleus subsp. caeruleus]ROP30675.1 asparagine synthase (glutamine-hydrolysing) [Couchioplanes caeruleus]